MSWRPISPNTSVSSRLLRVNNPFLIARNSRQISDNSAGNVGFVFTNEDLKEIRDKVLANKIAAPARAGAVAPLDVYVPAGNTGMEPGKTSFFQALGIPTKIARGTIEITTDLKLVEAGSKVGASEATLLNMLNISPFTYGMGIAHVYDQGQVFAPSVLDIDEAQLLKSFLSAVSTITTISLAANYPTLPSVIHSLVNSYKRAIAVALGTDYSWDAIEEIKDRISNPEAYTAAAPAAAAASGGSAPAAAAAEAKKEESEAEESDEGMFLRCVFLVPRKVANNLQVVSETCSIKHLTVRHRKYPPSEMKKIYHLAFTLCMFSPIIN